MHTRGHKKRWLLVLLIAFGILAAGGLFIFKKSPEIKAYTSSNNTVTTKKVVISNKGYKILSPASVPPKIQECSEGVSYDANGVPGPLQCPNGNLNIEVWAALASLEPRIFGQSSATPVSVIQTDMCFDVRGNITDLVEKQAYQAANLYYGWNFSPNPTAEIGSVKCTHTDDSSGI